MRPPCPSRLTTSGEKSTSGFGARRRIFSGCLADEDDVKAGRAVFYFDRPDVTVRPIDSDLPRCGLLRDDRGNITPVVAVQAESHPPGKVLVGYRPLTGGNGICTIDELELLDRPDSRFA
jgi:hypothetical protein